MKRSFSPYTLLVPTVGVLLVLTLFPTIYLLYLSLCRWDATTQLPAFTGITNYLELLFRDSTFWLSFRITMTYTIGAVLVEFILGLIIALLVNQPIRGIGIIRTLLILPMAVTPVVVGLTWRILYDPTFGLINYLLNLIGIKGQPWVGNASTALPALIIVDVWQWTPFMFLMLTAGLEAIPSEPYEAATVDGASWLQSFRHITLPLLRPVILVALLFRTIDAFKIFDTIFIITKGGPGTASQTLNIYAFMKGFEWFDLGYAAAIAVLLLMIITIIAQLLIRGSGVSVVEID